MQFIDDEFLLLSRGGRISPGTNARLGERTAQQLARQELAERAGSRRDRRRRQFRALLPRPAAVRAARGIKRTGYRGGR